MELEQLQQILEKHQEWLEAFRKFQERNAAKPGVRRGVDLSALADAAFVAEGGVS